MKTQKLGFLAFRLKVKDSNLKDIFVRVVQVLFDANSCICCCRISSYSEKLYM